MTCVDVIVLNYNGIRFLDTCLTALRNQTFKDFRVLLVDNSSSDGSVEYVRLNFPEVNLLVLTENLGFCKGNNRGIQATAGKYVALLNNDTEPTPYWLEALVSILETSPEIGFCASKLIQMSDRKTIDTAGDVFYSFGVGSKRGHGISAGHYDKEELIFGACAGAALYRRSMLDIVGLFDEDFFAYDEDIDLSFRAQLSGYRCYYEPTAVVYHHVGGSFGKHSDALLRQGRRNVLEVLLKNMPAQLLLKYLPWIVIYYLAGDLIYIMKGHASAILGARWENVRRFPCTIAKRRQIQKMRKISINEVDSLMIHTGFAGILKAARTHLK